MDSPREVGAGVEAQPDREVAAVLADSYPNGASRSTVPPNVVRILPRLPDGLEYRIVGNHLVLLDARAALVVDYLTDVMCAPC